MAQVESPVCAEEIRTQMRGIRRDLRVNVKGMVANASQMFDWKSYVRSFPWASVTAACVLGYLVVPRRSKLIAYDKQTLENFLKEHRLVVAPPPVTPPQSIISGLLQTAGSAALRMAVTYAAKHGAELVASLGAGLAAPKHASPNDAPPRSSQHTQSQGLASPAVQRDGR